jgi:predicted pyridoxine 5'-phosphate oxidase superfamily flavin-nucleotide-binding protein
VARLTEAMKEALAKTIEERSFCLVGSASADGWPNVSYRGSVAVLDDHTITFWERTRRQTLRNLEENPRCVIFYRNRERQANWRFFGYARVASEGEERERAWANTPPLEQQTDPEKKGFGVFVTLDHILDGMGNRVGE